MGFNISGSESTGEFFYGNEINEDVMGRQGKWQKIWIKSFKNEEIERKIRLSMGK